MRPTTKGRGGCLLTDATPEHQERDQGVVAIRPYVGQAWRDHETSIRGRTGGSTGRGRSPKRLKALQMTVTAPCPPSGCVRYTTRVPIIKEASMFRARGFGLCLALVGAMAAATTFAPSFAEEAKTPPPAPPAPPPAAAPATPPPAAIPAAPMVDSVKIIFDDKAKNNGHWSSPSLRRRRREDDQRDHRREDGRQGRCAFRRDRACGNPGQRVQSGQVRPRQDQDLEEKPSSSSA